LEDKFSCLSSSKVNVEEYVLEYTHSNN
jgi:hypothetical protein